MLLPSPGTVVVLPWISTSSAPTALRATRCRAGRDIGAGLAVRRLRQAEDQRPSQSMPFSDSTARRRGGRRLEVAALHARSLSAPARRRPRTSASDNASRRIDFPPGLAVSTAARLEVDAEPVDENMSGREIRSIAGKVYQRRHRAKTRDIHEPSFSEGCKPPLFRSA